LHELRKSISDLESTLQDKSKRIALLQNELKLMEQRISECSATVKQFEERIYSGEVTTVKELKILEEKQDAARIKVEGYEGKALEIMEELDNLRGNIPKEEEMSNKKKREYDEKRLKTCQEIDRIKVELTMKINQKQQLETSISPELLDKYHKIRRFKRDPVALVSDGKCNGCMMEVSVMIALEVERHQSLIYCENCGRILV
jgi:predicted  nucleic acid-binding Zn-ribbon protein